MEFQSTKKLAQYRVSNLQPIRLTRSNRKHHKRLRHHKRRQRVPIHHVNPPIHNPIPHHPKKNQQIHPSIKIVALKKATRESPPPRRRQRARRNQNQPPVKLRLLPPINRQRKCRSETKNIKKRHKHERRRISHMIDQQMDAIHRDRRRNPQHRNHHAQRDSDPTHRSVQQHVVRSNQRRLKNKKRQPSIKNKRMHIKYRRRRRLRMNNPRPHRPAESVHHHDASSTATSQNKNTYPTAPRASPSRRVPRLLPSVFRPTAAR